MPKPSKALPGAIFASGIILRRENFFPLLFGHCSGTMRAGRFEPRIALPDRVRNTALRAFRFETTSRNGLDRLPSACYVVK